jgi:hypothetical protein
MLWMLGGEFICAVSSSTSQGFSHFLFTTFQVQKMKSSIGAKTSRFNFIGSKRAKGSQMCLCRLELGLTLHSALILLAKVVKRSANGLMA